jgi:zinc and cadmium transporter
MIWLYTITSVVLISLISLIGLVLFGLSEKSLKKILLLIVSFSAGALLGDAFLHLIPEAVQTTGFTVSVSFFILSGILISLILEQFISWNHCHEDTDGACHPFVYMNLVGDAFHNFLDGAIIAASFLISTKLGIITSVAVLLHEIPQEIGDFGVLLHGGFTKKKALLLNFLTSFAAILGAVIVLSIGVSFTNSVNILLLIASGGFIYIASADLIPEIHRQEKGLVKSLQKLFFFILGIVVMYFLL